MLEPNEWPIEDVAAFRGAVLDYFERDRRDVPWRVDRDAYRVLVSEFMLQQTRTETVIPYFQRWTAEFPDVERLAEAEPEAVLKRWEGLGYYSRARNLHRTAREIVARYGGLVPRDPDALRTLPGVGAYTAGAVASIAYGVPVPAVDGNVRRVMARVADDPNPTPMRLQRWTEALVDPHDPGAFNQGLMELGSRVCLPRSPACDACPLERWCRASASGTQEDRPRRKPRREVPHVHRAVVAVVRSDPEGSGPDRARLRTPKRAIWLRRRPDAGLLAGMWELPSSRIDEGRDAVDVATSVAGEVEPAWGGAAPVALSPVAHAFSHRKVTYRPFLFGVEPARGAGRAGSAGIGGEATGHAVDRPGGRPGERSDARWVGFDELDALPIPAAQRKVLGDVLRRLGAEPNPDQLPKSSPESPEPPSGD